MSYSVVASKKGSLVKVEDVCNCIIKEVSLQTSNWIPHFLGKDHKVALTMEDSRLDIMVLLEVGKPTVRELALLASISFSW